VGKCGESEAKLTGEFLVPGESDRRTEEDHRERYSFASRFANGKEVVDIACGVGYAGPILLGAGAKEYLGVDINKSLVEEASRSYGTDTIHYAHGDICDYQPAHLFDLVLCFETVEHVGNYKRALANIRDMLRDDGLLIVSSPNRPVTSPKAKRLEDKPSNEFHTQEFTIEELVQELRGAGFGVDDGAIYGQRLSFRYAKNRGIRRLARFLFGDPRERSSPRVTPVGRKTPRYFLIVAQKSGESE